MQNRLLKIGDAAALLGVPIATLRKWEASGELMPDHKTTKGTRYYDRAKLMALGDETYPTVCYGRVGMASMSVDLDRQREVLETYCAAKGWRAEIITDTGSGLNARKPGLHRLLEIILRRQTRRIVVAHKDSLLRFGSELVFALCELQNIEVVVIHKGSRPAYDAELAEDLIDIIAAMTAQLSGSRSQRHRQLLVSLQAEADRLGEEYGLYPQQRELGTKISGPPSTPTP